MLNYPSALWRYRSFILSSFRNEVFGRFARSKIGGLWVILHPLAMALIYVLVLSEVLSAKIGGVDNKAAYAIYLMSGIAAWSLFSDLVGRCLTVFIEYGATLKRIMFPRLCLPIIVWLSATLNHVILVIAMAAIFALYDHMPSIHWVALPLGFMIISLFGLGLGIFLGLLNTFSRDIGQFMLVVLNLWFWLTPIVYTQEMLPDRLQHLMSYNPMTQMVGIYQDILLFNRWPNFEMMAWMAALAVGAALIALVAFRRGSVELVDVL